MATIVGDFLVKVGGDSAGLTSAFARGAAESQKFVSTIQRAASQINRSTIAPKVDVSGVTKAVGQIHAATIEAERFTKVSGGFGTRWRSVDTGQFAKYQEVLKQVKDASDGIKATPKVDTRPAVDNLHHLDDAAKKSVTHMKKLESAGASLRSLLGKTLGIVGVSLVLRDMVGNIIDAQNQLARMTAALKSTGGAAGYTVEQLEGMSKAFSAVSIYSSSAVQGGLSRLLTYTGIQGPMFEKATQAALDMASALGIDVATAAERTGNSLQYPTLALQSLSKQGFRFSEDQKRLITRFEATGQIAKAQEIVLGELTLAYGGAAAAARDTLGGALANLKNSFEDTYEVSQRSSQGMIAFVNAIADAMPHVRSVFDDVFVGLVLSIDDANIAWQKLSFDVTHFASHIGDVMLVLRGKMSVSDLGTTVNMDSVDRTLMVEGLTQAHIALNRELTGGQQKLREWDAALRGVSLGGSPAGQPAPSKTDAFLAASGTLNSQIAKQAALNAAFGESDLALKVLGIQYDAMAQKRVNAKTLYGTELASVNKLTDAYAAQQIVAARLAASKTDFRTFVPTVALPDSGRQLSDVSKFAESAAQRVSEAVLAGVPKEIAAKAILAPLRDLAARADSLRASAAISAASGGPVIDVSKGIEQMRQQATSAAPMLNNLIKGMHLPAQQETDLLKGIVSLLDQIAGKGKASPFARWGEDLMTAADVLGSMANVASTMGGPNARSTADVLGGASNAVGSIGNAVAQGGTNVGADIQALASTLQLGNALQGSAAQIRRENNALLNANSAQLTNVAERLANFAVTADTAGAARKAMAAFFANHGAVSALASGATHSGGFLGTGRVGDLQTQIDALAPFLKSAHLTFDEFKKIVASTGIDIFDKSGRIVTGALQQFADGVADATKAMFSFTNSAQDQRSLASLRNNVDNVSGPQQDIRDNLAILNKLAPNLMPGSDRLNTNSLAGQNALREALKGVVAQITAGTAGANAGGFQNIGDLATVINAVASSLNEMQGAVSGVTNSLTNMATGFKYDLAVFDVTAPGQLSAYGGPGNSSADMRPTGGATQTTTVLQIAPGAFVANGVNDPDALADGVMKTLGRRVMAQGGSPSDWANARPSIM